MKNEFDIVDIVGNLQGIVDGYVKNTKKFDTQNLSVVRRLLAVCAIELLMGPDPHSGGRPHPDTIECLAEGLLACIELSNARPSAYADEPWREQTVECHAGHALGHVVTAKLAVDNSAYSCTWRSDLGQPEIVHAAFRCFMMLWAHEKASKNE
mgnify:CR=1 FL=1